MNKCRLSDVSEFFLRSSYFMKGIREAWYFGNTVFVSPALFQLLTDVDDMDTIYVIVNQFILRKVSLRELMNLITHKTGRCSSEDNPDDIVRFQIVKRDPIGEWCL
ncbi:MAG TPA: hypothetical protein VFW11_07955 [Cyclobacteriaceae bacterium]|nr:hypothetical protein [Cyclobacteriaceae bacterium]